MSGRPHGGYLDGTPLTVRLPARDIARLLTVAADEHTSDGPMAAALIREALDQREADRRRARTAPAAFPVAAGLHDHPDPHDIAPRPRRGVRA